jgi:hypothetical protein
MSRFVERPVVHVLGLGLLLGLALLVAIGPPTTGDESRRVVVTAGELAHLRMSFVRTWQREPTPAELRGELQSYLKEEILYREAVARGYDEDDLVVRRAMQRKMEFLGESQGSAPPTDDEIRAYYALRQDRYATPAVSSFRQVYFSPDERGERVERDALDALREIRLAQPSGEELERWGDPIMLQGTYEVQAEPQIAAVFGEEFARSVSGLPKGQWQGPVRSGYGLHLVLVTDREDPQIPDWTEVRDRVVADMQYESRNAAKEQLFQEIAQQYRIVFDDTVRELMESAKP